MPGEGHLATDRFGAKPLTPTLAQQAPASGARENEASPQGSPFESFVSPGVFVRAGDAPRRLDRGRQFQWISVFVESRRTPGQQGPIRIPSCGRGSPQGTARRLISFAQLELGQSPPGASKIVGRGWATSTTHRHLQDQRRAWRTAKGAALVAAPLFDLTSYADAYGIAVPRCFLLRPTNLAPNNRPPMAKKTGRPSPIEGAGMMA